MSQGGGRKLVSRPGLSCDASIVFFTLNNESVISYRLQTDYVCLTSYLFSLAVMSRTSPVTRFQSPSSLYLSTEYIDSSPIKPNQTHLYSAFCWLHHMMLQRSQRAMGTKQGALMTHHLQPPPDLQSNGVCSHTSGPAGRESRRHGGRQAGRQQAVDHTQEENKAATDIPRLTRGQGSRPALSTLPPTLTYVSGNCCKCVLNYSKRELLILWQQ